jgi:hypothetical protein
MALDRLKELGVANYDVMIFNISMPLGKGLEEITKIVDYIDYVSYSNRKDVESQNLVHPEGGRFNRSESNNLAMESFSQQEEAKKNKSCDVINRNDFEGVRQ